MCKIHAFSRIILKLVVVEGFVVTVELYCCITLKCIGSGSVFSLLFSLHCDILSSVNFKHLIHPKTNPTISAIAYPLLRPIITPKKTHGLSKNV